MFNTLGDFLTWAEKAFVKAKLHFGHGTDNAWDDAVAIALFVLNLPPDVDKNALKRSLKEEESTRLQNLAERRIKEKIPVPYLCHTAWFSGLPYYVNENVLIPRSPLAELIQKQFEPWKFWQKKSSLRILELCTGSGCIAVALAKAFPKAKVDAIDIDKKALSIAKMNIIRHGVETQVFLHHSDLFNNLKIAPYDIIISNPPYVAEKIMDELPVEYSHEPKLALEAGQDGLRIVHRILHEAPNYLSTEGILIVEVGSSAKNLIAHYPKFPFIWLEFKRGGGGVFLLNKQEDELWKLS